MHIVVIGAGIVGIATAHALLDSGHRVTIVDPAHQPGRPCDGNAGWIAHTDILPLASPKAWRHLPRWLMDPLGPLAVRPGYALAIAPWIVRFIAASRPDRIERSIEAIRALNAQALPAWRRRLDALALSHHLRERGFLSVWGHDSAFLAAAPVLRRQQSFGIEVDVLDRAALRSLEPALGERAVGGALYPAGCNVSDPKTLVSDLTARARERGIGWVEAHARAIDTAGDRPRIATTAESVSADKVVIAAGAWSKPLAACAGDMVPLDTERGYNVTLPPGTLGLSRPVAFEGEGFVTTRLDIGDRIGGAVEFAGLDAPPNHGRVDAIVSRLRTYLPELPKELPDGPRWMGFRPSIPDSLPVIGWSRNSERVIHAFGHAHQGLTQAAITAELVVAMIDGRPPPIAPSPYSAARFRGGGPSRNSAAFRA
jgi:D-amino-acid dehydrogenase